MSNTINRKNVIDDKDIEQGLKVIADGLGILRKNIGDVVKSAKEMQDALGGKSVYKKIIKDALQLEKNTKALNAAKKKELELNAQSYKIHNSINKQKIAQQKAIEAAAIEQVTAAQKNMNGIFKEHVQSIGRTNDGLKKMSSYYKELERETAKTAQQKAKEAAALEKQNRALANQGKRTNGLATSFKKLAKSVAGYFLAIASVQRIVQFFTRDLLNMNKKLDSQEFAMKTVIKDNIEYKTTIAELSEIAKKYGQDLLVLRERYIKFRAAAIQSNVSAQDTMKIFNSTAKAAGVLGLKSDELNGVFLALEQMLSKGKVTTEELRRQLGERLPGAMGIMADAIGVTISELDKMMKKGEVLSSMALPKFAEQLERAYGIEYVTNIDTLAAAQGRMNTAWIEFVESIESSEIYIDVLNKFAKALTRIRDSWEDVGQRSERIEGNMLNAIEKEANAIDDVSGKREFYNKKIDELVGLYNEGYKAIKEVEKGNLGLWRTLEGLLKTINPLHRDIFGLYKILGGTDPLQAAEDNVKTVKAEFEAIGKTIEELNLKLKELAEVEEPLPESIIGSLKSRLEDAEYYYELMENANYNSLSQQTKDEIDSYKKRAANFKDYVKILIKDTQKEIDTWTPIVKDLEQSKEEIAAQNKAIDEQTAKVKNMSGEYNALNKKLDGILKKKERKALEEELEALEYKLKLEQANLTKLIESGKQQNIRESQANKNLQEYIKLSDELNLLLTEKDKKTGSDDRLQRARLENEIKIADFQRAQRERWQKFVEKTNADELLSELEKRDKIAQYEAQMNVQLLEYKRDLNDELSKINGLQSIEYRQIAKDDAEFMKQIQDEISQESTKNKQRDNKILIDEAQKLSKATIDQYYDMADAQYISAQKTSLKRIEEQKLTNRQIEKLQRELAEHQVEMDILAVQGMLESGDLYGDDVAQKQNELQELYKRLYEIRIQNSKKGNEDDLENLREWAQAVGEVFNTLMDILQDYYDRQLDQSKNLYEKQVGYAGASVEERLAAETMYQKRDAEIKKKKAIAEKIQTIFNIGLGMLQATAQLPSPMAIAQLIAGGAAMAAAVATPIPAYSKGGKHEGGVAKVSEKGEEIFIDKKGKAYLTPKKETIANFPAGEFIPHDKTQQMLAEYAMNQQAEMLDMTNTNNYLKNIERNTKNNAATEYVGGYKIVRRNGVTSKIRTR